jgi:uncharacterized membrane protein YgaE (UPF0421/DUF939 family)
LQHRLAHAGRDALAALASLGLARVVGLPEPYWACITTFVVLQAKLRSTVSTSWQRMAGTALGVTAGALLSTYFGTNLLAFAAGVFAIDLLCAVLHLDNSYRMANITLAIVMLIPHKEPPAIIALHRFLEVGIGIGAALVVTSIWPEAEL